MRMVRVCTVERWPAVSSTNTVTVALFDAHATIEYGTFDQS